MWNSRNMEKQGPGRVLACNEAASSSGLISSPGTSVEKEEGEEKEGVYLRMLQR